jgi:adenosine deaminase
VFLKGFRLKMPYFADLPKIELHCHLDGSVRLSTLKALGVESGLLSPNITSDMLKTLAEVTPDCPTLTEYLKRFKLPLQIMQSQESLRRIARELVEDAAKDNVRYIEIRFAPQLHQVKGLTLTQVIESALEGVKEGEHLTGTRSNLILCCMRHLTCDASIELVESGKAFLGRGVVAVDLAGDEHHYPPELHKAAFDLALSYGYHRTVHAGETGISANIRKSLILLHAERIGHGVCLREDPELLEEVVQKGIPLEMCPTSNLHTKAAESYWTHPIHTYMKQGVRATLNTDNRTVSGITMGSEVIHMVEAGLDLESLRLLYFNAAEAIFDSESEKQRLRDLWPTKKDIAYLV